MFQSTVNNQMAFGVVGEIFDSGPHRAQPFILDSDDAALNVFGRAFTVKSEGVAEAGKDGSQVFAGILISPKEHVSYGTEAGGPLAASITLPNGTIGTLLSEGSIVVALPANAAIGDLVYYTDATGVLTTTAPGAAAPASSTLIEGAYVDRFTPTAVSGYTLAVITLSPNSRAGAPAAA
jgi:hypothetical protein